MGTQGLNEPKTWLNPLVPKSWATCLYAAPRVWYAVGWGKMGLGSKPFRFCIFIFEPMHLPLLVEV